METDKEYINVNEAAIILNCSAYTVRKLCRENKLKSFKKLKQWYVYKESIKTYIEK